MYSVWYLLRKFHASYYSSLCWVLIKANLSYKKCKIVIKVRHTKTLTTYNVWYIGGEIQEIELTRIIFISTSQGVLNKENHYYSLKIFSLCEDPRSWKFNIPNLFKISFLIIIYYMIIFFLTWYNVTEANGCHCNEAKIETIKKCPVLP